MAAGDLAKLAGHIALLNGNEAVHAFRLFAFTTILSDCPLRLEPRGVRYGSVADAPTLRRLGPLCAISGH